MSNWEKSSNPIWPFTPSPDKRYYDEGDRITSWRSPIWTGSPYDTPSTPNHIPCGYWPKHEYTPTLSNGTVDVYIEMYNVAFWEPVLASIAPGYSMPSEFERTIDTNDYDGNPTYWFEVCGANTMWDSGATLPYSLYLVDTSDNVYATITFDPEEPVYGSNCSILVRKRVQFTPAIGSTTYTIRLPSVVDENSPTIGAVRLIIKQSPSATKSMIQIPLQCLGDWGGRYKFTYYDYFYTWPVGYSIITGHYCTTYEESIASETDNWEYYAYTGLWKFNIDELSNISKIVFEAVGGTPPQLHAGTGSQYFWYWVESGSSTASWSVALFDDTDTMVPDSMVTGHYDEMVSLIVDLPLTSGTYHPMITIDGISWSTYDTSWTVDHTPFGGNIKWSCVQNPWFVDPYGGGTGLHMQFSWTWADAEQLDSLYIALFDATTSTMVSGSELIWEPNTLTCRKQVELSPSVLTSGHDYEIRFKVPDDGGTGAELGFESNLYIWVNPIENLTVWQRVAKGEYRDYMGRSEPPWTADESRILANISAGQLTYFENVAFSWGDCPSDPEFPCYYSLLDMGTTDYGINGDEVIGSELTYDSVENTEFRYRMRSEAITLIDGNRYTTNEPNDESELFQVQAFIVVKR